MDRTALVTGASSGIGRSTALRLAAAGFRVTGLVADRPAAATLRAAASEQSLDIGVAVADLGDPRARDGIVADLRPWALVNNAGYMNAGRIQDVPLDDARRQLEVMVIAAVDLTRQALPAMIASGQGRIVNITTSAVHTSTPLTGWYQATKAAWRELTDSLRLELRGTGVEVVDVEPGGYRTGIWDRALTELRERREGSNRPDLYDRVIGHITDAGTRMGDPSEVADVVADVLTAGHPPLHRRVGPGAALLRTLDAIVPDRLWDLTVATLARTG
jgi:NAD(P)-dependent dehydrogenase (short-subunit alcohol dehydrogenase family)